MNAFKDDYHLVMRVAATYCRVARQRWQATFEAALTLRNDPSATAQTGDLTRAS
jgi:hypothetical protein